jgi:hypothetical protein
MRARSLGVAALVAVAGCANLSGLTGGGTHDAAPADAGGSRRDGAAHADATSPSDATSADRRAPRHEAGPHEHDAAADHRAADGARGDAGAPRDAANDAVSPSHWCDTQDATFCVDFDEVPLGQDGFTMIQAPPNTKVVLDSKVSVSHPSSLDITVDTPTACTYARVERAFTDHPPMTTGDLAFSVLPDYLAADAGETILGAVVAGPCTFIFYLGPTTCAVQIQATTPDGGREHTATTGNLASELAPTVWATVDVGVTLASPDAGGAMSMSVNGTTYIDNFAIPAVCQGPGTMTILPGAYCVGPGSVEMHFDNLTFRGH